MDAVATNPIPTTHCMVEGVVSEMFSLVLTYFRSQGGKKVAGDGRDGEGCCTA